MNKKTKGHIVAVHSAFPAHQATQAEITEILKKGWKQSRSVNNVIDRLHRSVLVKKRHLSMPVDTYANEQSFAYRNQAFIDIGVDLAERCVRELLLKAHVEPQAISQIIFTTVTGIAVPSIDARLMNRLAFSPHVKRTPIFGLGCVGGAAGLARAADYLVGHPDDLVVLLSLELCSLTFQKKDLSIANMIACGLFGDGAAAVLLAGNQHALAKSCLPKIVDNRSFFFPQSEDVMGWQVTDDGFKIILNADVPKIALEKIPSCVDEVLKSHRLHCSDIASWIAHPGGPKVIQALIDGLKLPKDALEISYDTLAEYGNLSSASVLLILEKTIESRQFRSGDYGMVFAMGPGFCAELVVLRW
jgi:alkylresorcinol/alkylpyrone synthase